MFQHNLNEVKSGPRRESARHGLTLRMFLCAGMLHNSVLGLQEPAMNTDTPTKIFHFGCHQVTNTSTS